MAGRWPHRHWHFDPPTDAELDSPGGFSRSVRLHGRWTFLDAVGADPESLDDAPRPSDLKRKPK